MQVEITDMDLSVQLVDLAESHLSGKMRDIPENIVDLEVDWEIDPDSLHIMEKIGALGLCAVVMDARSCLVSKKSDTVEGRRQRRRGGQQRLVYIALLCVTFMMFFCHSYLCKFSEL
jgi:hypothetical protein